MSDIIHLLPDSIANQIAAGEVIQRPASVVKELVENAIDAGAANIRVIIKDAGRTLIQVIDDGAGMSDTDARMAFERHATSKITAADDLFALRTMGFRGEALASIAAVAHVELRTRLKGTDLGTRLVISGSLLEKIEPDACVEGCIFSVKNLFYNVPARRKFLKANETEFRHIINEFERVALVNPEIAFILYHNDFEILNLPVSGLRQRIINVYGKNLNDKLLSINAQSSMVSVSGFVGRPDSVKRRGALQFFFVNGRFMKHPYFHRAVMRAYENLIPEGELPNYFIYLVIDPSTIDVNIHPTKTEIKFENEQPIWQILLSAVRETLAKSSAIPTIDFDREDAIDIPVYSSEGNKSLNAPQIQIDPTYNPFKSQSSSNYKRQEFDWDKLYKSFEGEENSSQSLPFQPEFSTSLDVEKNMDQAIDVKLFEEISSFSFQYKGRYIITSLKSGLAIIDQHHAHVRILFDQYVNNVKRQQGASQQLLFPEVIELSPVEISILPSLLEDLHFVGFDLSNLGQGSYAINGLPVGVEHLDPVSLVRDVIQQAIENETKATEDICCSIALSLAKAAAIRPGKILTVDEMEHLQASLFSSTDSYLTPDGKIILTLLTDDELEKRFSR